MPDPRQMMPGFFIFRWQVNIEELLALIAI